MTDATRDEYAPDRVSPPGATLAETLAALGMSQAELALRLGRPRKTVNEIIKGKAALEPATALQLESVLGVPAAFWMEREARYRESLARSSRRSALAGATAWAHGFPFQAMVKLGWLAPDIPRAERAGALLRYFGVASVEAWENVWTTHAVAFRRAATIKARQPALAAWLRQGEIQAQGIACGRFQAERFKAVLNAARPLTREPPEVFQPHLTTLFASAGVALAWVPELPGAPVSGATRWLSEHKALIQVSLRYKTDDQLFFAIFHEAAHVLLHPKKAIFLEDHRPETPEEHQANAFAAEHLIPPAAYERLVATPLTLAGIERFAAEIEIAPGCVVGRLQHDQRLGFQQGNGLKRRLRWHTPPGA